MEIVVSYTPSFVRQFRALESFLQDEVIEKIESLQDRKNHKLLKVHKLHGRLAGRSSFSVNYKTRIVFSYISKNQIVLLAIGSHDIYRS